MPSPDLDTARREAEEALARHCLSHGMVCRADPTHAALRRLLAATAPAPSSPPPVAMTDRAARLHANCGCSIGVTDGDVMRCESHMYRRGPAFAPPPPATETKEATIIRLAKELAEDHCECSEERDDYSDCWWCRWLEKVEAVGGDRDEVPPPPATASEREAAFDRQLAEIAFIVAPYATNSNLVESVREIVHRLREVPPPPASEVLARFGAAMLAEWWNDGNPGDIDGGEVQEIAEKHGLWHQVERHADGVECEWCGNEGPCGELTEAGLAALAASGAGEEGEK